MRLFSFSLIFCSAIAVICSNQKNFENEVIAIKEIKKMPYIPELSGDSLFWSLVQKKLEVVPELINCLNDTTITQANVPNFGGYYTVADISYYIISEIIKDIPTDQFVDTVNSGAGGYWMYWNFVRTSYDNRLSFQKDVEKWYDINKSKLVWVEDNRKYRTAIDWKFPTSRHPAGGHYFIFSK
ncbi:MAG: hypothetical protein KDC92_03495 [Bacteroidetes bacterium]|nr:hypothetical protein [Bacteroidota bacterium]